MSYISSLCASLDVPRWAIELGLAILALLVLLDWYVSKPSPRSVSSVLSFLQSTSERPPGVFDRAA
jgi:hypothetical protein